MKKLLYLLCFFTPSMYLISMDFTKPLQPQVDAIQDQIAKEQKLKKPNQGKLLNFQKSLDLLEILGSQAYLDQRHALQQQVNNLKNVEPITFKVPADPKNNAQFTLQDQLYKLDMSEFSKIENYNAQLISDDTAQFTDPKTKQKIIVKNPAAYVFTENGSFSADYKTVTFSFAYQLKSMISDIKTIDKNKKLFGTPFAPVSRGPVVSSGPVRVTPKA